MTGRKQFTFYRSFWDAVKSLPGEDRLKTLDAICEYALDGVTTELEGMPLAMFTLIKPTLDSSRKKAAGGQIGKRGPKEPSKSQQRKNKDFDKTSIRHEQDTDKIPIRQEQDNDNEGEKEKEIEIEIEYECTPPTPSGGENKDSAGFDAFWNEYPKHAGREEAEAEWKKLSPGQELASKICQAVRKWTASDQWREQQGRFIPRAERFLRDRLWLDAPDRHSGRREPDQDELEAIRRMMGQE